MAAGCLYYAYLNLHEPVGVIRFDPETLEHAYWSPHGWVLDQTLATVVIGEDSRDGRKISEGEARELVTAWGGDWDAYGEADAEPAPGTLDDDLEPDEDGEGGGSGAPPGD